MKYSGIGYLINEGFKNVFKNKKSTFISIITMICTMFLFGLFFAIGENVNYVLRQVQMQQGMQVFIWDETTEEQRQKLETEIKALDGVNKVTFKTKEEALDDFKSWLKDRQNYLIGLEGENNVLPASFVVTLTELEKSSEIQDEIKRIGAQIATEGRGAEINLGIEETTEHDSIIKDITSKEGTISALIAIVKGVRITIGIIFIVLLAISVTIISNTIKLTVHARRKEISIMKYVGATDGFIRWPFIVEGIIIGLISAIITLVIVGILYDTIIQKLEASKVLKQMGVTLLTFIELAKTISIVYGSLGVGIGVVGSSMSMKKYLDV